MLVLVCGVTEILQLLLLMILFQKYQCLVEILYRSGREGLDRILWLDLFRRVDIDFEILWGNCVYNMIDLGFDSLSCNIRAGHYFR